MNISSLKLVYFSPTKTTQKVLKAIAQGVSSDNVEHINLTPPESITKTFAAVAVMQLVEAGRVGLDDTLEKWVPYYPVNRSNLITLRHVLTHTSGIRHYHYERGEKEGLPPRYYPSLEAASNIYGVAEEPLLFTPGMDFCYSSYASRLLGEVIERASGVIWEAYVEENIFLELFA